MQHWRWIIVLAALSIGLITTIAQDTDFMGDDAEPKKIISFDEDLNGQLTRRLVDYAEPPRAVIEELVVLGELPTDGRFVFDETSVALDGDEERQFVNLAQGASDLNVVMGATIIFDPRTINENILEFCGLAARAQPIELDEVVSTTDYISVVVLGNGNVVALDTLVGNGEITEIDANLQTPIAVNLLFIAEQDRLAVYINGELRLFDMRITEEQGSYGVRMGVGDTRTNCELRDVWAYTYTLSDDVSFAAPNISGNDGLCLATSAGASKRSAPSTAATRLGRFDGESIEVIGQITGTDNFTWYLLIDNTYVREDVVTLSGECSRLPPVNEGAN